LFQWLEETSSRFNQPSFIPDDPISIPHRYVSKEDIEIAGLFSALLAWGRRSTIIQKAGQLMDLMGDSPHDFIVNHAEKDRRRFMAFRHRTFQPDDILFLLPVLQDYYRTHTSLEEVFAFGQNSSDRSAYHGLTSFYNMVFGRPVVLERTRKHIATPERHSACKRLNMYLRWMVRRDDNGVDFGIWRNIDPANLIIPLDIHVGNVARRLGLLQRSTNDWNAAIVLTDQLKEFDSADPVKYDFALFGAGVLGTENISFT